MSVPAWSRPLKLHELGRGAVQLSLSPDEAQRAAIARQLGLEALLSLDAQVTAAPWLDGVELTGRLRARVAQVCGVSLETFEQDVEGGIEVRAVPAGSPHATEPEGEDFELDLDAPDPPDILDADTIDVAAYVVEHLALEIDPFPRKPGAAFEYEAPEAESSPFAALKKLTEPKA